VSDRHVELIRAAFAAAPEDPGPLFALLDEHVVWDYVGAFPESATYHGPDEVRAFFGQWAGAFDDFEVEAEDVTGAGDHVVVRMRQSGRGKETGARVENRVWQVFTFRAGKIVHCRGFEREADAFAAAGIRQ
jgi:ketosteroid isomerase-like protein